MSKAFTRESDDMPERPFALRSASPLPAGAKNYLTPQGTRRLHEELERLLRLRSSIGSGSGDGTVQRQNQELDERIHHLQQSLQSAVVVPKPADSDGQVRFGATVTVRERGGSESRYRIVGIDETDIDRNWVSWISPIARALLNAQIGQRVRFKFPAGEKELEIVGIAYE